MSLSYRVGSYSARGNTRVTALVVEGVTDEDALVKLRRSIRDAETKFHVSFCIEVQSDKSVYVTLCPKHQLSNAMLNHHLENLKDHLEEMLEEKV